MTEARSLHYPLREYPPLRMTAAAALAISTFTVLSLIAGVKSQGFLEADSATHYLYARFAALEPEVDSLISEMDRSRRSLAEGDCQ